MRGREGYCDCGREGRKGSAGANTTRDSIIWLRYRKEMDKGVLVGGGEAERLSKLLVGGR